MKSLGILLVLSALTPTAYSIICKSCWHSVGVPCYSPVMSCPVGNICVAAYSVATIGNSYSPQYSISCGTWNQCNLTGSLSFNNGKIRTGTSCCSTDNCNPTMPILPVDNPLRNGLVCRTCLSDSSDYCYTKDTMSCTGEERKCGRMGRKLSGTINLKDAMRGCATKTFCDVFGNQVASISGLNIDSKMYCSDGVAGLHTGVFLSVFVALLAKLLF